MVALASVGLGPKAIAQRVGLTRQTAVVEVQQLVLALLLLLRKREPVSREPWRSKAQASDLPEVVAFARGLVRDKDAVMGALTYKESNGLTEGHVNRLKMLKRTAYGRASFELLRKRVLARV